MKMELQVRALQMKMQLRAEGEELVHDFEKYFKLVAFATQSLCHYNNLFNKLFSKKLFAVVLFKD